MVELEFFFLGCSVKNELVVDTVIKKIAKLSHMKSSPCEHHIRGNCANMSLISGHLTCVLGNCKRRVVDCMK